jgi:RNA polymerase sigma-70 factor (ECF subfamily)
MDGTTRWAAMTGVVIGARLGERSADTEVVIRARAGEASAFDVLVRRRLDAAYALAFAILREEADARDAVQEAFLSAWRELRGLRDPERFDAWLTRIVVNTCRSALRRRHRVHVREVRVVLDDGESDPGPEADSGARPMAEALAQADAIRRAFVRLRPDERTILALHHVEERPVTEIAAILGIPVGTAKWRLHAARKALERVLGDELR